jgi:hypothetical protein
MLPYEGPCWEGQAPTICQSGVAKKKAGEAPLPDLHKLGRWEDELLLHLDALHCNVTFVIGSTFHDDFVANVLFRESLIVQRIGFLVGGAVENQLRPAVGTLHGAGFVSCIVFAASTALSICNPSGVLVVICHQGDTERQYQAQAQQDGNLVSHVFPPLENCLWRIQ